MNIIQFRLFIMCKAAQFDCTILVIAVTSLRLQLTSVVKLQDRVPSKGLRERIGLHDIISVLQQNRLRKLGVEEWLVSAVMSMYTGAKTVVICEPSDIASQNIQKQILTTHRLTMACGMLCLGGKRPCYTAADTPGGC